MKLGGQTPFRNIAVCRVDGPQDQLVGYVSEIRSASR
jgi:hypothetical protein